MKALFAPLTIALMLTACSREGQITTGGVYVKRTGCPQVAIPAATGDVTLFDPANFRTAAAIDVSAAITNVRSSCAEEGAYLVSTASYDVVATRRDPAQSRQVVLPIFSVATQGGTNVVAKRIGAVAVDFAAGSARGQGRGQSVIRVARSAAALPANVQRELTRERKPGDANAAVDPLSDPTIREAVAAATFEHLIGFQLTQDQLRYNATR